MGKKYLGNLRIGFVSFIMFFALSLLVSCGGGGGDDGGAPSVGSVTVDAGSDEIVADGVSSIWVRVTARNSEGELVDDGTSVTFRTTAGTLSSSSSETTDGQASVFLISSTKVGTATVTATAAGASSSTAVTFIAGPVSVISLTATPSILNADGESSSTIRAEVSDANGNAVDGEVISFTLDSGSGTFSAPTATTVGGVVTVTFTALRTPGTAVIRATSTNNTFSTISIILMGGGDPVAEEFGVFAAFLNISGLWYMNLEDQISAGLADVYGNAVKDSTVVDFKTYNTGGFITPTKAETTSGFASTSLFSTPNPAPMQGFLSVTAETVGGYTTRVTAIEATPYPDNHIVYLGTNGGGIYKSTNSGQTWENISRSTLNSTGQNFIDPYIKGHSAICVDPDNHNTVYAGTGYLGSGNVFRSLDGGMNWNSDNLEEWGGLYMYTPDAAMLPPTGSTLSNAAVLTVLCDGDDNSLTDYPYVWIGTEGKGFLYAADGKHFQPSGGTVNPISPTSKSSSVYVNSANTGNGYMTEPSLWYSSQSETWTVTCHENPATSTDPVPDEENAGDGIMSAVTTSDATKTEDWIVTYSVSVGEVTGSAATKGNLESINLKIPNAASETWTLRATDGSSATIGSVDGVTSKGTVTGISVTGATKDETFTLTYEATPMYFTVVSDGRGLFGTATPGTPFTSDGVNLTISTGSPPYADGDIFSFEYSVAVPGTTFSVQSSEKDYSPATVGEPFDEDGLSFQINEGSTPFVEGEYFRFTTTACWQVIGTVSGLQTDTADTDTPYTSDNNEVAFTIWTGSIPYEVGDKFTFSTIGKTTFWMVDGSKSGIQQMPALNNNFYRSDNYEVSFMIIEDTMFPFEKGDEFKFHVDANDINHGKTVWDIERIEGTHGAGAILYAGTATGVFKSTNGGRTWTEPGNFTGDYVICIELHPASTGGTSDVIYAGTQNGAVWVSTNSGISWKQYSTGIEAGSFIKDIVLDPTNNVLYAITYQGPVEAAAGAVYAHTINTNGSMKTGGWKKVSTGLGGTALHALAIDNPADPGVLFTGGEGISFSRSIKDLTTGNPTWMDSNNGLSNIIMARMPILFSGQCTMSWDITRYDNTVWFKVYIEDQNGNPPIEGSTFTADVSVGDGWKAYDITYGDCYTHTGTFRDPGNPSTNNPYWFSFTISPPKSIDEESTVDVELTFTPENTLPDAPGSSGQEQTYKWTFAYQ